MFLLRLKPFILFLLIITPLIIDRIIFRFSSDWPGNYIYWWGLETIFKVLFALIFILWIFEMTNKLVVEKNARIYSFIYLSLGTSVMLSVNSSTITECFFDPLGPDTLIVPLGDLIFNVILWLGINAFLLFLSHELVNREQEKGIKEKDIVSTFLLFLFFPIGIWFIQPRMRKILEEKK